MSSNRYLRCVQSAKEKYTAQVDRPGYPKGWFTWLRHSKEKNPALAALESQLTPDNESSSAAIIANHFSIYQKFNNHSFNTYLLDELLKTFPKDDWQRYHPKPILYYQGKLFRGSHLPPQTVFKYGFIEQATSTSLDDYVSDCNGSIGVSTSKSYTVALKYAVPKINPRHIEVAPQPFSNIGYVYEINYRGHAGIDLESTHLARQNHWRASLSGNKQEVNIIGHIDHSDIVKVSVYRRGIFSLSLVQTIENSNYRESISPTR